MHSFKPTRRQVLSSALAGAAVVGMPRFAFAQDNGVLRVGLRTDINNFDPQRLVTSNFPVIKNLFDSLIEYTADGEAVPSLASSWTIADDNTSVSLVLRDDVTFHGGGPFDAESVAKTLEKGSKAETGGNLYPTMSIVDSWSVDGPHAFTVKFKAPTPTKQITDLLQFVIPIDPATIADAESKPSGTGPYMLDERQVGQSLRLKKNPNYWREGEPAMETIEVTIFSDDDALGSALESGVIDLTYGGLARTALRLQGAGYQVHWGPGTLTQVFRINSTRAPFDNKTFRQAFNHLMNRAAMLKVGYAGMGEVTSLPWAPVNPAADPAFSEEFAFDLDKARELLTASGLSPAEMSAWKLLTNGGDEAVVVLSQILQATLAEVGINIELDMRQGAEYTDAQLKGDYHATFGGVGNVQKFPTRVTTNSIYRTTGNPVLGDPNPHTAYVEAVQQVDSTVGDDVQAAYNHLNRVLVEEAFAIPTNSIPAGIHVAAPDLEGFTMDIDNILVARTIRRK